MKKLFLAALGIVSFWAQAHAITLEEFNYIPVSSFTDASTPGPIMFTSATIQFVGVTVASPSANGYIAFYRSTSPVFTADIATQTVVGTDDLPANSDVFVPLFEMKNTSYTFLSKVGNAQVTLWFRCPKRLEIAPGVCPGLKYSGQK